jgi:hypothetical protein
MRYPRRPTEASLQAAERRKREDESTRLKAEIPKLSELSLDMEERMSDTALVAARHKRHIVVASAPAMFEIRCSDSNCKDGGHDLTWPIMKALRAGVESMEGEDACAGQLGSASCRRVLHYTLRAKYLG